MKYEVDRWYPWWGGDCPVHGKTEVICMFQDGAKVQGFARQFSWPRPRPRENAICVANIVAFKVLEEYEEPREFWALISVRDGIPFAMYKTWEEAWEEAEKKTNYRKEIVKVREVKE
jgi:hypothetical protein